jgi:hypothetical protein
MSFTLTREERARILYSYEMRNLINTVEDIVNARFPVAPPPEPTQDQKDWDAYREWHGSVWGMCPKDSNRTSPEFLAFRAGRAWREKA